MEAMKDGTVKADGERMTWFERIKACKTPEKMAELLDDGNERSFCPFGSCGREEGFCRDCIVEWMNKEART